MPSFQEGTRQWAEQQRDQADNALADYLEERNA